MTPSSEAIAAERPQRMLSLDAFRGFDIAAMLAVNMTWNREVFSGQLFHVTWDDPQQGATFTDLVFPWFVFIAGAALPWSIESGRGNGRSTAGMIATAARRAAVLYLLGVLLTVASRAYETPLSWMNLLEWNILQLIGASYLVMVCVWLLPHWCRPAFVVLVLVAKWAAMTLMPWHMVVELVDARPPEGAPVGPGTWTHFEAVKRTLNMQFVQTPWLRHLGGWLGMSQQYLPLAAVGVMGGMACSALRTEGTRQSVLKVLLVGAMLLLAAFALQWNYVPEGGGLWGQLTVPFSKLFFSPAYCLLAAGTGMMLLAAFYAASDLSGWSTFMPLRVYGTNAIALYVGAELSFKTIFSKWQMPLPAGGSDSLAGGFLSGVEYFTGSAAIAGWAFVLTWLAGWWCFCWWLYRRKIFLRI